MRSIYIAILVLCTVCATGQVKTRIFPQTIPARFIPNTGQSIPLKKIVANEEFRRLLSRQKDNTQTIEYKDKFAIPVSTYINLLKEAKATTTKSHIIYTLTVDAESALNISAQFSQFRLSPGAVLSIFTQSEITDSITANQNNAADYWSTRVYQGNTLTFLLNIPIAEKGKTTLIIDQIRFGYKKIGTDYFGNSGASADCNINVACPAGVGWENERNSVALIVASGTEIGTGALIMNTCNTNIPYLLTANHLPKTNLSNWVFQFQTWSSTCALPNTGWTEDIQFNGCQLRANDAASDFTLVELNTVPPANSGITYSGWNRGNIPATSTTGIHHPSGDLMKISHEFDAATAVAWQGGPTDHWQVTFDQGIVQHGSSGSPLYDQNHRIVGQLHGYQLNACDIGDNDCFCIQPPVAEYGRFDISWAGAGTNATRLSNWLDPNNSGATTTNTTNISALSAGNVNLAISGDNAICTGSKTYTINTLPNNTYVVWSTSNGYATVAPIGNGSSATVTATLGATGYVNVTATLFNSTTNCAVSNIATKTLSIGGPYAGFNIVVHPGWPTSCWEAWAFNYFQAQLAWGSGYTAMEWGYTFQGVDYIGIETWDTYTFLPQDAGTYEIFVRPKNSCGVGPKSTRIIEVGWGPCGWGFRIQVSPNPAKNMLYVTIAEGEQQAAKSITTTTQLTLREVISGRIIKQWKVAGTQKQLSLNIAGIKKGNYMLTVEKGNNRQSKQIIIE